MTYRDTRSSALLLTVLVAIACGGKGRDVAVELGSGGTHETSARGGGENTSTVGNELGGSASSGAPSSGGAGGEPLGIAGTATISSTFGGATNGGAANGGATNGGATNGGATNGGAASGGATNGGAASGGATSRPVTRSILAGALQKGPFVLGSSVLLSPLNAQGISSGAVYSTQTTNNLGEFQFELEYSGPISIEGSGYYYNEVSGTLSTAPLTLRALYNLEPNAEPQLGAAGAAGVAGTYGNGAAAGASGQSEIRSTTQSAFVNLITHLAYFRVKALVSSGATSLATAISQAEAEVRSELGIGPVGVAPATPATSMNLLGGDTLANAYSFAVSTVLAQAAARRSGPIDANLQELLNSIASDLADDGVISAQLKQELRAATAAVDPERVMKALGARLSALGSTATVPNLNRIIDSDFDGVVNAEDCMPRDPLRWTNHADLDGDGHIHVDCKGDDCDDDNPNRYTGNTEQCGDSTDNDCDGIVDDGCPCGGLFGPTMVRLPRNYCIDSTEVTRAQYQAWLDTTPSVAGQTVSCQSNVAYAPDSTCMAQASVCQGSSCGNHPQICVDWCDAYAYCQAAGKRLCGAIGGGPLTYDGSSQADPATNQWYSACSSNGQNRLPYGNAFSPAACNAAEYGASTTVPVASMPGCQSPVAGYTGIYDMSGNAYEWIDVSVPGNPPDSCFIEGGAFDTVGGDINANYLSCQGMPLAYSRDFVRNNIGFRCCWQ